MPMPIAPPKPRVVHGGDCWILDTGHADVLHDTWGEAIAHASRICADYLAELTVWVQGPPRCDAICDGQGGQSSCFTPWCRCTVCHNGQAHRSTGLGDTSQAGDGK